MKKEKINNPYSWDKINGDTYWEICDILNNPDDSDMDKSAKLCCCIEGMNLDDFYNLPVNDATKKINQLSFLNNFKLRKNYTPNYVKLGDYKCKVVNAEDMCVAAFIDYQNFITLPFREGYDKILSIFLIPENYKYNDGYDIKEIQRLIRENMLWVDVQSLLNFILTKYMRSLYNTLRYLVKRVKKMKGCQEKKEMEMKINQLKDKFSMLMDTFVSSKDIPTAHMNSGKTSMV